MDGIRPTIRTHPRDRADRGSSTYTELAQQVRHRGLLRRRYGYYWSKLVGAPLVLLACLCAFVWIGDTWWQLFTAALLAIVFTQIAFLGHDAAHRRIFVSGRWNDWVSIVLGDRLVGMSYGWWQHKHTRHHANPNKLGSDPDIELPVIAVTAETAAKNRGPLLTWLRGHQGLLFFPILLLEGISLHASSVRRVFTRGRLERRWAEITFPHLRRAAPVIAAYCRDHDVPYTQTGLFASYAIVVRYINHVGLGERDVFTCPLIEQRSAFGV